MSIPIPRILKSDHPDFMADLQRRVAEQQAREEAMLKDTLKMSLQVGEQIVALTEEFHDSGQYSQKPGDIIRVNNPKLYGITCGHGIYGVAYNGRNILGLGSSLKDGTYRRATHDDPGYMDTREGWVKVLGDELKWERRQSFWFGVVALMALGALALTHLHDIGL